MKQNEKGQALILVLILLLLGGLIMAPLLSYMSSGLKAGQMYENKMMELYAADSGVEDALWKIMTEDGSIPTLPALPEPKPGPKPAPEPAHYIVPDINDMDVNVTVENIWVLEGLEDPPKGMTPHEDWAVVGRNQGGDEYQIEVTFTGSGNPQKGRVGVWLPNKFEYVLESCSLYPDNLSLEEPTTQSRGNGTILIWEGVKELDFKVPEGSVGCTRTQTFNLMPGEEPAWSLAWIGFVREDVGPSWDGTLGLYKVTSIANGTTITSHIIKYGPEVFINTWEIQ